MNPIGDMRSANGDALSDNHIHPPLHGVDGPKLSTRTLGARKKPALRNEGSRLHPGCRASRSAGQRLIAHIHPPLHGVDGPRRVVLVKRAPTELENLTIHPEDGWMDTRAMRREIMTIHPVEGRVGGAPK